ncbi:MAG: PAS domain S-box protein [Bacteroidales bacterium]|nr:PAS domain S-box protein [Bacteroidales bacterium]
MKNSTIFKQLVTNIIIPVCLGLIILAIYNIRYTKIKLTESNNIKNQILINEINHIMQFQDLALMIHEDLLEERMRKYSELIINKYLTGKSNIDKIDLNKIREDLNMDPNFEDIYIIDQNGIVVNTTFRKDYNLNFFNFGIEHEKYLREIFENKIFKSERFTIEARTKRLRKYTYQPAKDGKYIVELGTYSKRADEIIEFIKAHLNKLSEEHTSIKSVDLFIVADNPFSLNKDAILIKDHEKILNKVFKDKHPQTRTVYEDKNKYNFDYIYLDIRNTDLYKGAVIRIITDRTNEKRLLQFELLKIVFLFCIIILIIFSLIYKKSKDISLPIQQLAKNIKRISDGNFDERTNIVGNSEVVELSNQFNSMLDNIEARNKLANEQREEIEAQKQQLININKDLEKLSLVASKTNNAVSIYDEKGNLQWFNVGFERLYGYTFNEVIYNIGENIKKINENPDIDKLLTICLKTKQSIDLETETINKSGNNLWIQTTLTPVLNEKNDITGLVAIDTNITAIKNVEEKLRQKNKDITDSISYAKKIQEAILPHINKINTKFKDLFILLKPKSIVSGDFFWYSEINNNPIIAAADCTGHGIPGAFMSIIGNSLLNKIVSDNKIDEPAAILYNLRENLSIILNRKENSPISKDGIDIALCKFNFTTNTLEFAGSFNPLYIVSKNIINIPKKDLKTKIIYNSFYLYEIKPDRYPVGITERKEKFNTRAIQLSSGDKFYLFTDGFADQFGGEKNKKFKYNNFKNLIIQIQDHTIKEQKKILSKKFDEWKGENEQIDDLLIVGIEI